MGEILEECNICGAKDADRRSKIEGVILAVCKNCVKLGEEISMIRLQTAKKTPIEIKELQEYVVPGFSTIIRSEREKRNLTQEQLSTRLNEKISVIKRVEEGWEPSLELIRKLEKFFRIKLTEELKENRISRRPEERKLTIGDIVEVS